jgi:hypothetical protein
MEWSNLEAHGYIIAAAFQQFLFFVGGYSYYYHEDFSKVI